MIEIQLNHPFSTGRENLNLSRRLTKIFGRFKSDPSDDQTRPIIAATSQEEAEPRPSIAEDTCLDSVSVLYKDTFITLHEDHITIHNYYVPSTNLNHMQIHYREIACVYCAEELKPSNNQCKTWGSTLAGIWWALDKKTEKPEKPGAYRHKYDTMILTLHNSKRIEVSIKDSCQIECVKRLVQEANDTIVLIE